MSARAPAVLARALGLAASAAATASCFAPAATRRSEG